MFFPLLRSGLEVSLLPAAAADYQRGAGKQRERATGRSGVDFRDAGGYGHGCHGGANQ
ncbi:MAG TPA: hypothetical protein VMU19_07975 [Bryobacteraceae bacterium]|nr:hypothetical protein [Bryobacteraceae bacterium]